MKRGIIQEIIREIHEKHEKIVEHTFTILLYSWLFAVKYIGITFMMFADSFYTSRKTNRR